MDIKLDNILLGKNYQLKLCDFDLATFDENEKHEGYGSKFYRAPELLKGVCKLPKAADIYSLGIVLFLFKTGGRWPHLENEAISGLKLWNLMKENRDEFWSFHSDYDPIHSFKNEFTSLFDWMTEYNPEKRPSFREIKKTEWFCGPVYSNEELEKIMKGIVELQD